MHRRTDGRGDRRSHNYHPVSLDTPVDQDEEDSCPLADTLGTEEDGFDLAHERQALAANWGTLSAMERQVLGLRLGQGLTQREISRRIGYSQMHVSRVLRKSLLHLEVACVTGVGDVTAALRTRDGRFEASTDLAVELVDGCASEAVDRGNDRRELAREDRARGAIGEQEAGAGACDEPLRLRGGQPAG